MEHLNVEERKHAWTTRIFFHLRGEVLSSATAVTDEIRLEPSTELVNASTYRLPESQKQEVRRQDEELKRGGIITEDNSSWNSPLLVVSKKADATCEKRWRRMGTQPKVFWHKRRPLRI